MNIFRVPHAFWRIINELINDLVKTRSFTESQKELFASVWFMLEDWEIMDGQPRYPYSDDSVKLMFGNDPAVPII